MTWIEKLLPRTSVVGNKAMLMTGLFAGSFVLSMSGQVPVPAQIAKAATPVPTTSYQPNVPKRERSYYQLFWGVDSLNAKAVESGELIKFSYRVLDPEKAKILNEKTDEPAMYDPAIRAKLVVPSLEKVGQLRQTATPEEGKIYWMAFSNPGRVVKRGDRSTWRSDHSTLKGWSFSSRLVPQTPKPQSCRVDGWAGVVRCRDRQNHAFGFQALHNTEWYKMPGDSCEQMVIQAVELRVWSHFAAKL